MLKSTAKRSYTGGERGNRVLLLERMGLLYRANDRTDEAVDAFRQIGDVDSELGSRSQAQVIDTYRMAKQYDKAMSEADAGIAKYPE